MHRKLAVERLEAREAPGNLDALLSVVGSLTSEQLGEWSRGTERRILPPHPQGELVVRAAEIDWRTHPVTGLYAIRFSITGQRNALVSDESTTTMWAYRLVGGTPSQFGQTVQNVQPLGTHTIAADGNFSVVSTLEMSTGNGGNDFAQLNAPSYFEESFESSAHDDGCLEVGSEVHIYASIQFLNGYPALYGFGDTRHEIKTRIWSEGTGYSELTGSTTYDAEASHYLTIWEAAPDSHLFGNPQKVRIQWVATPKDPLVTNTELETVDIPCPSV